MSADLAFRIVKARAGLGWSQLQLAEAAGVAPGQISRYESGKNTPRPQLVAKLAAAMNVSFEWLANGHGTPNTGEHGPTIVVPKGVELDTFTFPDDIYAALEEEARRKEITVEMLVLQYLRTAMKESKP